jgi:GLPGLI family protein
MTQFTFKTVVFVFLLLSNFSTKAQNFYGKATYISYTTLGDSFKVDSPSMNEQQKKEMLEMMRKALEKTFTLDFNAYESLFQEEAILDKPKPNSGGMMVMMSNGDSSKLYKNTKENKSVAEKDIFDKAFLVVDSLTNWNWKIETETKKIGDYVCQKASAIIPVTKEDLEAYEKMKSEKGNGKTQFIIMDEPKEVVITAWFTMEIPVATGPEKYSGLPGLILEVNDGRTSYLCSKIVLNPKDKVSIKAPTKGKVISEKEFRKVEEEKLKSMMNKDGVIEINMTR